MSTMVKNVDLSEQIAWVNEIDEDVVFDLCVEDIEPITVNNIRLMVIDMVTC